MKFTDNYVKNLQSASEWFEKIETSGLGIRVTPGGSKSWFYRFTFDGKRSKMSLGSYPNISLKEARVLLFEAQRLRESGINPVEYNKQKKETKKKTVQSFILNWYEGYIEKNRKKPIQIKQQINADIIPLLGKKELDKLLPRDITESLDLIVARGSPVHANKVLSTLKQAFNYGVSRGEMLTNPAANIRSRDIGGLEKPRDRYLSLDEVKKLWLFLDGTAHKLSLPVKSAIKIIVLTGVRTGEILQAKWEEIDLQQSLWIIPPEHSKNGLTIKIHLSPAIKKIFEDLSKQRSSKWIISDFKDGRQFSEKSIAKAISRIQERLKIPKWTAHDLRRTFATLLGEVLHIDAVIVEKCLGHKMPKIMATYNKNEMLPQRKEALEKWSNFIEELVKQE